VRLQPGQILADKYRIVRLLGEGGMGAVYEGENVRIRRRVAIKLLHAEVARRADVVQRFEREAQAAGRIGSEHIVEVLDLGDLPDGARFMVMEFLEGESLAAYIKRSGRVPPEAIAPLLAQLLVGLEAAHAAGIVHRDLKPANVHLVPGRTGGSFVKILDFGVSKFSVLAGEEMSMTRTGAVVGTPYYMAPEQARGARGADARADLYSVGVILYEAVTGQVPFLAETFNELLFKIALETPPPPEQFVPTLDPAFGVVLRKAMAREAVERFQSAREFAEALAAWAADFEARRAIGPAVHAASSPAAAARAGLLGSNGTVVIEPGAAPVGPSPIPPVGARRGAGWALFGGLAVGAVAAVVWFLTRPPPPEPALSPGRARSDASPPAAPAAPVGSPRNEPTDGEVATGSVAASALPATAVRPASASPAPTPTPPSVRAGSAKPTPAESTSRPPTPGRPGRSIDSSL
jgi:tRNA A-37 threonylcarbamoyl transferase component Bud32